MTGVGAAERLDAHYRQLEDLLDVAEAHAGAGRHDAAAAFAQIAGQFAWMNHTGLFASDRLEALLAGLGQSLPAPAWQRSAVDAQTVLHVITQTYQTGGPTRAVRCWLEQDLGRRHRVCVTRQGVKPPPTDLVSQIGSPGDLIRLDARRGLLTDRARALRELAAGCDVVLLHTHPYDVVPLIAFAGAEPRPPVVYVNHSDHVFWLGTGVSDLVMNMRDSGRRLTGARRGVEESRSVVMPRPLLPPDRSLTRAEAKRRLGIPAGQILLVTTADAPKYRPVTRPGFLDLVLPVLHRHPQAMLIAAGPRDQDEWRAAAEQTHGQVRAVGRLPDVTLLQQAADIYLDSYPFASLTSLLEAGSFATPAITYRGHPEGCEVLGADTPGLDEHLAAAERPGAFEAALDHAIDDADWRLEVGARTQRAILDTHTGDGWRAAARELYRQAAGTSPAPATLPVQRRTDELDLRVDAVMELTGYSEGPTGALRDHMTLLPVRERAGVAAQLVRGHVSLRPRHVIPESLQPTLGELRESIRRRRGRGVTNGSSAGAVSAPMKIGLSTDRG